MANVWQKAFQRIFWKNKPYTDTPLGESKLLPMDASIDTIDDRVVTLQSTKAEQSDFLTALKNIQYNPSTGVFTITKFNDSSFTIDTDIEKIAINFDYDDDPTSAHYQQLIITLDDGTVKYVDLSALITEYEFGNTSTINFTVSGSTGIVTANIINGSITSDHLAPSVMASINAAVNSAEAHAEDSEAWARGTKDGTPVPSTADQYQNNSKYYSELSEDSAEDSEAYAKGTRNGTAVSSDDPAYHNNAKYWSDQAVATLNNKVDKEVGKGLSSNDFTNALKDKLDGIASGAEVNVQSDWSQSDNTADDFIKNKPTKLSDFSNDTNFITNTVSNLTSYYLKSETYTQAEVNALIAGISGLTYLVVQTLPTQDISTTTIYLVPKATAQTDNVYDEYLYINNAWECIGSTTVDLSNYYTKSQTDTLLNAKVSDNPTFTEASTRANIASGETFATILGKIKKFFTDLKDLAFIAKDGSTSKYLRGDGTWQTFPTIPTVNNATLTIQKNGTTVQTFTANASSNVTCNITMSKSDVGLGNVDNTADANKSVNYANSAGYAGSAGYSTYVQLGDGIPMVYSDSGNINFRFYQSDGVNVGYSNLRDILDRCYAISKADILCSNVYLSTSDNWNDVTLNYSIRDYEYLGFSFSDSDNINLARMAQIIIPVSDFLNTNGNKDVPIVKNYWNLSSANNVSVCYHTDTKIYAWRGGNIYQYFRLNCVGYKKI